ncbi:MAG: hypothetical protein QXH55_02080 [Candidatus Korarchaeota archaeon]|nr:hypothetical protein [Thermoproteota archaeon]
MIPIRSPYSYYFWIIGSLKSMLGLLGFQVVGLGPVGAPFDVKFSIVKWIQTEDFLKFVVLEVKGIYTTPEEFEQGTEEYDKKNFYYDLDAEEIIRMSERNDAMGKEYVFIVLPRYYENTFDPLAVVFSVFVSPKNLLGKLSSEKRWYSYEDLLRGFTYYTFSAFIKALYRCKIGLGKEHIMRLLSERGITPSYPSLITLFDDIGGEKKALRVGIVLNFTKRCAMLLAISKDYYSSYAASQ